MSSLLSTVKGTSTDQEGVAAAESAGEMAPVAESSAEQEAPLVDASAGPTDGGENPAGDDKQR